ncbi:dihydrolipoamide acetyltransferase family protein [Streptomyces sp. ZYX-F-203]
MTRVLEFRLPDLGEGLTEAEIVRWLVDVGDVVVVDQPVVEVETAKASVEVPCPHAGVVTARFGEEGEELPVGSPLLTVAIGVDGEAPDGDRGARAPGVGSGSPEASDATGGSGNVLVGYGTSGASSRRRRVRPAEAARPSGAGGRADGHPRPAKPPEGPVPVISPLVRRLARQHQVDLRELRGSGPEGLILRSDVEDALGVDRRATGRPGGEASRPSSESAAPADPGPRGGAPTSPSPGVDGVRTPLRGLRGAVADKLSRSRREIPDATCWVDADATELIRARTVVNGVDGPRVSLMALLARICAAALARHPELNARVDHEAREIVRLDRVHLGFAAQTARGLVVPVVRDADTRSAESFSAEFARLTEAARNGTLTPAQLTGGTFTLNNYGVFGVDGSTPIINHPEAAMLGVGRVVPKPWAHAGELAVRQVVQLSLTFDHRVCDGGTAGGFLRYVADCVEQPAVLLRTL